MDAVHDPILTAVVDPAIAMGSLVTPSTSGLSDTAADMNVDAVAGPSSSKPATAADSAKASTSKSEDEMLEDSPEVLSDFLHQLEDYTPTIPDAVTAYFCQTAGFEPSDPRIVRLISIAAQKFVSDVANDALQHCKTRTNNVPTSHASAKNPKAQNNNKDRKYALTMEDLAPALGDYGITVRKAHYFV